MKKNDGTINVVDMRSVGSMFEEEDATIPQRNMYLAMVAANLGYTDINIIAQKEERSIPDRSASFFRMASEVITYLTGRPTKVSSPFADMDKIDMVRWYIDNLKDMKALEGTWACYTPVRSGLHREPCGNCPACFRRFNALILNGYHEQWFFRLKKSKVVAEYYLRAKKGTHYSTERSAKILAAIKMLRDVKLPPTV
jgi:7-cyano-7-deazaguanine synthase in queuosine biosynthesis